MAVRPLLASRLIALDKRPGVRPIGIGDTARRIIAKAVLTIVASDVQEANGCRQMCGGHISGVEAAVHATRSALELEDNEAMLLVDALNRQLALHCKNGGVRSTPIWGVNQLCHTDTPFLGCQNLAPHVVSSQHFWGVHTAPVLCHCSTFGGAPTAPIIVSLQHFLRCSYSTSIVSLHAALYFID